MSGGGSKAPMPYQPTGSPQVDQNYQNLINSATPYAQALPGQVIPGLQQAAQNVQSNPYFGDAMYGAQFANAAAQNQVTPNMLGANYNLSNLGDMAAKYAPQAAAGAGYADPLLQRSLGIGNAAMGAGGAAMGAGGEAMGAGQQAFGRGGQISDLSLMAIPGLTGGMGAANSILNTGFDPQGALYNREQQKQQDTTNATNSMYGLGTSPFGAGVANDASRNFNIDWQNNQLQRQIQALGAYGTEQGNIANIANNFLNTSSGAMNSGAGALNAGANTAISGANTALSAANTNLNATTTGANAYNSMMGGAVNNYSNLVNTAGNAYNNAGQQGIDAIQTAAAAGALPSNTYLQQQQADIGALNALATGTQNALAPSEELAKADAGYLTTGQNAASVAGQNTDINNKTSQAAWGALGSAAGTAAMFLI